MQRETGCLVWFIIVLALVVFLLAWQYCDYSIARRTLPPRTVVADIPVGGMTRAQALNALEVAFAAPVTVRYRNHELCLAPSMVELEYDADQTWTDLEAALVSWHGLDGFVSHVLRRDPPPVAIPAAVTYSEEAVSDFLSRVGERYNEPPRGPVTLPASLGLRSGRPGYTLNNEASRPLLAEALVSAAENEVTLVVEVEQPPPKHLGLLKELLEYRLDDHQGLVPGVFVKDLKTGEELAINGDVAYAGLSVLKIAVLEEVYRNLDSAPGPETTKWISETLTESGNESANWLLRNTTASGNGYRAAQELTASMHRLGLFNTYMAAPYDEKEIAWEIATPANTRSDVTTEPDPLIQTTPADVGLLLEMIYHCSRGEGTLIATYPDDLTPEECEDIIRWMSRNQMDRLIKAGVPTDIQVAHKHGWTSDTHADAGLLLTPGGDFVLVVFLHRPEWLEWKESAPLFADIAKAAYNYFNGSP